MKTKTIILTLVFSIFLSLCSLAGESLTNSESERDVRSEYSDFKNHHLLDNHSFKLFKYETEEKTKYVSFPLPIILWDNGIQTFLSSKFYFGKKVVEHNGNFYKLYHNKIYKTDELGLIHPFCRFYCDIVYRNSHCVLLLFFQNKTLTIKMFEYHCPIKLLEGEKKHI